MSDLQHRLSLIKLLKSTSGCSGELTLNMFKKDPSPRLEASDTLSVFIWKMLNVNP